ncbi:YiiX/YebB-like N1pC/P60 family cysteine hydrolase [Dysgonomonas sp. HGC4]|uniref:YiiX/YebB-like N1pC/P60 family cysteine hydrolase n=1 Tax=Dysgonomonas sp. HGC4 TaxID=1658009 RepID=UPI0006830845|nr:YiiX/YebB-like N1pC/P60 family cysteine hydrolase [Dysgonomonas sp. HGC4]MBD8346548.1 hypothetical protein [Dysgonomonas sp. HGC4]
MLNIILSTFIFLSPFFPNDNVGNSLQDGDLIFQESCNGDMGDAIKDVTSGIEGYNFTHVGIVYIDATTNVVYVIEATHPKVRITPLQEYIHPEDAKCAPKSVVGRLKPQFRALIPQALEEAKKLVGKDYDDAFDLSNDQYYCSELIYDILLKANNNVPIFPLNVMTFKSKETGEYSPNWVTHFKKLGIPIPEGEKGINPGAMSQQSDIIDIIN